jgi:uncharacterized protein (DUF608 family)
MAAALTVPLTITSGASASAADSDAFEVPDSALVRALGEVPVGSCISLIVAACDEGTAQFMPYNTPGLGIPLGGIGAGSFMINQSGTFGPWFFGGSQNTSYEVRSTPQAALHVREQVGDGPANTRTLATDGPHDETLPSIRDWADPLPAWNTLEKGDADYSALYPFGWMDYSDEVFDTDVSMRFYSPIVAGDERLSSLPIAYFDVQITNTAVETATVSTMFTMPNVAGHEGRLPETIREGLSSSFHEEDGISAVTLSSDSDSNTPDAYRSEWTIAAATDDDETFSYVTSWNGSGDGADIYEEFADDGVLPDTSLDESASAGAIAVSATLEPGETRTIPFALTWDFPQVGFADNNTVWMRRYTEIYGAQTDEKNDYIPGSYPFHQSYNIAKDALTQRAENLDAVLGWWEPIVTSEEIPDDIASAAMNHLANVTFHTVLWENGLVENSVPVTNGGERIGTAFPGTHNYFGNDANSGGISTQGQGGEIGIYSYDVYSELFPFIERDRMRAKVEQILISDDGDPMDFDVTSSTSPDDYALGGNPFVTWNPHNQSSNDSAPGAGLEPGPGTMSFLDRVAANIIRMYDYAERNDDAEFREFAYPAMNRVLDLLQKTIPDDLALPEPTSAANPQGDNVQQMANLYNSMPTDRFDSYTSGMYLLALEAMIATGEELGEDAAVLDRWRAGLAESRQAYEDTFWNEEQGYYRYTLPQDGHALPAVPRRTTRTSGHRGRRSLRTPPPVDVPSRGGGERSEARRTPRGSGRVSVGRPDGHRLRTQCDRGRCVLGGGELRLRGRTIRSPRTDRDGPLARASHDRTGMELDDERLCVQHAVPLQLGGPHEVDLPVVREQPVDLADDPCIPGRGTRLAGTGRTHRGADAGRSRSVGRAGTHPGTGSRTRADRGS